jgi:trigger factor
MQVTETLSQGLKREYSVVISAGDLASKLDTQLSDLKNKVRINGFRPGKVPMAHLKKVYGRSVMADVVQEQVTAANKQIVETNGLRLAMEPKVELPTEQAAIEAALEARGDLAFKVALEVLPNFEIGDFSEITLERPVADVEESEIDAQIARMADSKRTYTPRAEGQYAEKGDRVTVDFVGTIDGEAFEGGTATDIEVILGSNTFIPGFEDALLGVRVGETPLVKATFPENYAMARLAGKTGEFATTIKAIAWPEALELNDEFAKGLGVESMEALRKTLRERMEAEYARVSREKTKRKLLDALAERYQFEVPGGLVEQEFSQIWTQVEREQQSSGRSFADEGTTEEAARAEYRAIAERRVRLGLVLADVGTKAEVKISDEEITRALIAQARAYPGQEKEIWDFYRNNQQALASLRAPIFEEKVVDHIIGLAKVEDQKVSREELLKADDDIKELSTGAPADFVAAEEPAPAAPTAE